MTTQSNPTARFAEVWPALPIDVWSDTSATLQLWMQMVGKIRLALTPPINHTWNVTLYPTIRGVTTSPMPYGGLMLQIDFDFLDHALVIATSQGDQTVIPLRPMTVADFYARLMPRPRRRGLSGAYLARAGGDRPADSLRAGSHTPKLRPRIRPALLAHSAARSPGSSPCFAPGSGER